jgi:phosphoglycolate phosphatase
MAFEGVIFDLDGTLADTLTDIASSMNRVLQAHACRVHPEGDYKILVGKGLENLVMQALPLERRCDSFMSVCLSEFKEDYGKNCLVRTKLYAGIEDLLATLQKMKVRLSVFSNKADELTQIIVRKLLPDVRFEMVIGAGKGFPKKPDPAGALWISEWTRIPPERTLYVGDSDVDMMTATRAGMYPVGVLWGFRTGEELLANGAAVLLEKPYDLMALPEWNN